MKTKNFGILLLASSLIAGHTPIVLANNTVESIDQISTSDKIETTEESSDADNETVNSLIDESNQSINTDLNTEENTQTVETATEIEETSETVESSIEDSTNKSESSIKEDERKDSDTSISTEVKDVTTTGMWGTSSWTFSSSTGLLTFKAGTLTSYTNSPWNTRGVAGNDVKKIVLDGKVVAPAASDYLFSSRTSTDNLSNLEVITGLSNLDTSQATSMIGMFYNCRSLTSLDVSQFNTSQVTDMASMFYSCGGLTSLDMSNFDTRQVKNMYTMFSGCGGLTSLDVSNFDTRQVINMGWMFYNCQSLTSLDVTNFDTSQVTTMANMFYSCEGLTSLDVSNFDTSQVKTMASMFSGCGGLTSLDVSQFNTSQVTTMASMFSGCGSLTNLDVSNFDTSQVTTMASMFSGCGSLTSLDVSNFDTSQVTNMSWMFPSASSLTNLDLSSFDTSKVTNMSQMLLGLKLEKLTLGSSFKFYIDTTNSPGLGVPVPADNQKGTGNWIREDGNSKAYSPDDFMENYGTGDLTAGTYVAELDESMELNAEANPQTVLLGTDITKLDYSEYVKNVTLNNQALDSSQYTVNLLTDFATDLIGSRIANLRVSSTENPGVSLDIPVSVTVEWGSSIVSLSDGTGSITSSVSLLDDNGKPYLNANRGNGWAGNLLSRQSFGIYREAKTDDKLLLSASYGTVNQVPQTLATAWNNLFKTVDLEYGDVMVYTVFRYSSTSTNHNGANTWISRNNALTRETQGYREAYYELTKTGYNLLHLNQLSVNNNQTVPLGASEEEMDEMVENFINVPSELTDEDTDKLSYKFIEADTSSPGTKTGTIQVSEKLESGGVFTEEYTVNYTVQDGSFRFSSVPTIISFGDKNLLSLDEQVTLPIQEKEGDLIVEDGMYEKGQWVVQARMAEELTTENGDELLGALQYDGKALSSVGEIIYKPVSDSNETQVIISKDWGDQTGLYFSAKRKDIQAEEYSGEIEWSLINAPGGDES